MSRLVLLGSAAVVLALASSDVWAADRPGRLAPAVRGIPERVYVPNSKSDTVTEIDPRTFKVLRTFRVGHEPQHVVPSYDVTRTQWLSRRRCRSPAPE